MVNKDIKRIEPHYCELCGCVCVLCAQLQSCDDCDLLYPQLLFEENDFSAALIDHFEKSDQKKNLAK